MSKPTNLGIIWEYGRNWSNVTSKCVMEKNTRTGASNIENERLQRESLERFSKNDEKGTTKEEKMQTNPQRHLSNTSIISNLQDGQRKKKI
jgi:hypothetical protein